MTSFICLNKPTWNQFHFLFSLTTDLPEVVHVTPDSFYQLDTTRTWDYLGLSVANPKNLLNDTNMGEEVIIGIVDSGLSVYLCISFLLHCRLILVLLLLLFPLSINHFLRL